MRKELKNIEQIELYINNQLKGANKTAFEEQLKNDALLSQQVAEHKILLQAIKRKQIQKEILAVANTSGFWNIWTKFGLGLGMISIVALSFTFFINSDSNYSPKQVITQNKSQNTVSNDEDFELKTISTVDSAKTELEQTNSSTTEDISSRKNSYKEDTECGGLKTFVEPDVQRFSINPQKGKTIEGKQGTLVVIPPNAFIDKNGTIIKSNVNFELVEALTLEDMVLYNLTTTSNGKQLETGGMFYMNASQNGVPVQINPKAPIYTEIPTDKAKRNMLAFDSEIDSNGNINWIKPKPLKKYLTKIDLNLLDFLPKGFANGVTNGLPYKSYKTANKDLVDSLYYALDGEISENIGLKEETNLGKAVVTNFRRRDEKGVKYSKNKMKLSDEIITPNNQSTLVINTGTIKSEVLNEKENLAPYTRIQLSNSTYFYTTSTDELGKFKIRNIPPGVYTLTASHSTYGNAFIDSIIIKPNKLLPLPLKLSRNTQLPNLTETPRTIYTERKKCGIRPLSIKTLKTSEFEQTYIATKEMEERIAVLHQIDNGDSLLNIYISNLGKDLYIADSLVALALSGKNKEQFMQFYNQKLTNLKDTENIYQDQLSAYYTKKRKQYTQELKELQQKLNQKDRTELQQLSSKLDQNRIDYQKTLQQPILKSQQKKTQRLQSTEQTNKPKAKSKHSIDKIVNKIPKRSVASTPSYPAQWTSFGWKNIDQYTHLLANGYKSVEISTNKPQGFKRVFQYLNTIKTITPLLNSGNTAKANFPKEGTKEAKAMQNTYTFSLSKYEGKYFWGKVFYNPYTKTTMKIEEEETSLSVIRNELRHAGNEGTQAIKYFEKQLNTAIENKKNAERNKQRLLEEKRRREQLFKEFEEKQAKLKAEIERKRQEQQAEENFMNQLRGIAFPCYKSSLTFEAEIIEPEATDSPAWSEENISQSDTYSFVSVEQKPEFPGGEITLMKYLSENVVYPQEARDQELSGRVLVDFTIDIDGKVIYTKIKKAVHPLLDKEALRVVSEMPAWSPGKIRGVNVKVSYVIPVSFKLKN